MELAPIVGGRLLERYRIVEQHTEGGFGTVHVCWDEKLKRRVAIKTIPLTTQEGVPLSDAMPEALAEARTASFLTHPCIVPMLDFEVDAYTAYLIMEYIDGCTLADLIEKDGPLPFDEVAHVLDSLAGALTFAHENGVLHLDIKPANILIDKSGNVKLGDFGMANLASAAGYLGARGGTTGYMSPEQLEGQVVDDRSDVFALAAVVYEALTGFAPFKAENPAASLPLILRGAPLLTTLDTDIDPALNDIVGDALSPFADERPNTVAAFAESALAYLGNPREGRFSLAEAVEGFTDDTPQDEEWYADDNPYGPLPSRLRSPQVQELLGKIANGALFGWAGWLAAGSWPLHSHTVVAFVVAFLCAILGAFMPQLAFPVTVILLGVSMGISGAVALGVVFTAALLAYWFFSARNNPFETSVAIAPALLGTVGMGWFIPFLAGWKLPAHKAVITTAFGALVLFSLAVVTSAPNLMELQGQLALPGSGQALATHLFALIKTPKTWLVFAALIVSAALVAAGARSARRGLVVGSALGATVLCTVFAMLAQGMEIESFPFAIGPQTAIALIISFILYVCIYVLCGLPEELEGTLEDFES